MKSITFAVYFFLIFIISRQIYCASQPRAEPVDHLTEATNNASEGKSPNGLTNNSSEETVNPSNIQNTLDIPARELSIASTRTSLSSMSSFSWRTPLFWRRPLSKKTKPDLKKKHTRVIIDSAHYYLENENKRKHSVELSESISANILILQNIAGASKHIQRRINQLVDIEVLYLMRCNVLKTNLPTAESLKSLSDLKFSECSGLSIHDGFRAEFQAIAIQKLTMWRMQGLDVCPETIRKLINANQLKEIRVSDSGLFKAFLVAAKSECPTAGYTEIKFLYGRDPHKCHTIEWRIEEKQLFAKITEDISLERVVLDNLDFELIAVNLRVTLVNSVAGWMSYFESCSEKITTLILEGFVDTSCNPPLTDAAAAMAHYSGVLKKLTKLHTLQAEIIPTETVLSADELNKIRTNMQKLIANAQNGVGRIIFARKDQQIFQVQKDLKIDEVCGKWMPDMQENRLTCTNFESEAVV